jgi:hypothetical protein
MIDCCALAGKSSLKRKSNTGIEIKKLPIWTAFKSKPCSA